MLGIGDCTAPQCCRSFVEQPLADLGLELPMNLVASQFQIDGQRMFLMLGQYRVTLDWLLEKRAGREDARCGANAHLAWFGTLPLCTL